MLKNKRMSILVILYLFFVTIVGRLVFIFPNAKFLNILNVNNFYSIFCVLTILGTLFIIVFLKVEKTKKCSLHLHYHQSY